MTLVLHINNSGASLIAQLVKKLPAMQETLVQFLCWGRSTGEGIGYPLQYSWSTVQYSQPVESACNEGDLGSMPGLGRFPWEGKDYPFQYSGLGNSMDCIVHGVAKSWTLLSDFHSLTHSLTHNCVSFCCTAKWISFTGTPTSGI